MHGIVLKRMGHNVWILERSPSALLAEQGAGIGVSDDLEAFMEEYDLVRAPYMLRSPEAFVVDSQGSLITTLKPGVRATSWNTLYYRLRGNFDGLKGYQCEEPPGNSASDGRATYLYGRTLLSIDEEHERLVVKYHHDDDTSGSMSADLVIAADGTGSTIRGMMEPQAKRRYVGYCAWRGTILEQDMGQEAEHLCHGSDRHCQIERSFFLSSVSLPFNEVSHNLITS